MNIFYILIMVLFIFGYYYTDNIKSIYKDGSIQIKNHIECLNSYHNAVLKNDIFKDSCMIKYSLSSQKFCLFDNQIVDCSKQSFSLIISSSSIVNIEDYNKVFNILEKEYSNNGILGIFVDGYILNGNNSNFYKLPSNINLKNGQIVKLTQIAKLNLIENYIHKNDSVLCNTNELKIYKDGKFNCIKNINSKRCHGEQIWDKKLQKCIPDKSKKKICEYSNTAIFINGVWECVPPINIKCKEQSKLYYDKFQWKCRG